MEIIVTTHILEHQDIAQSYETRVRRLSAKGVLECLKIWPHKYINQDQKGVGFYPWDDQEYTKK